MDLKLFIETYTTISGLTGITALSIVFGIYKWYFKQHKEFSEILNSFPVVSDKKIKEGMKRSSGKEFWNCCISYDVEQNFSEFIDEKRHEIDIFLNKLEKFNGSKLRFRENEIMSFVNDLNGALTAKVNTYTVIGDVTHNEIKTYREEKELLSFNYGFCLELFKDKQRISRIDYSDFFNFILNEFIKKMV